jgi:heme-degrading monooxygenase HmoA
MIAKTPAPPYYAVIFSSLRTTADNGYNEMSEKMNGLVSEQDGFLGMESVRDRLGITVSYWRDRESIKNWRENPEHYIARSRGRSEWYQSFRTRIARVERDYEFIKDSPDLSRSLSPRLNEGTFVFCTLSDVTQLNIGDILFWFREEEGTTVVLSKQAADGLGIDYSFIASWITLNVSSRLDEVGLTAVFSKALSDEGISCNVAAAFNHDHLFVNKKDTKRAMDILYRLSY